MRVFRGDLIGTLIAISMAAAPSARAQDAAPPMPDAPRQFKLSVSAGALSWQDAAERGELGSSSLFGLGVERLLVEFLSVRATAAYGSTRITGESESIDLSQYALDVVLQGRLVLTALRELGAVPFLALSYGAIVHDPQPDDLTTRSQTALGYGLGIDVDLQSRLGAQIEWRHYSVSLQDLFVPQDRSAVKTGADRFQAALFWRF